MAETKRPMFKVETKRDAQMVKSFVMFTYRTKNPNVTRNFLIAGIVSLFLTWGIRVRAVGIFLTIQGVFCILMALFRQWIPITTMKRNDPDYVAGNLLTYEFYGNEVRALRNGEQFLRLNTYKKITNLYHDEYYIYLGANEEDLMILPKDKFVTGDPDKFVDYVTKKAGINAVWSPVTRGEKKKKSAEDAIIRSEKVEKQREAQMAEMDRRREIIRAAMEKRKRERMGLEEIPEDMTEAAESIEDIEVSEDAAEKPE